MSANPILTGNPGRLLTPAEAAMALHVSTASIYRWVASGRLVGFKVASIGGRLRIPELALERLLLPVVGELAPDSTMVEVES